MTTQSGKTQAKAAPEATGYLSAKTLLTTLWPDPISRPSLRWIREMQAKRALPFIKIGHLVFFEIERVRAALRKFEISPK